MPLKITGEIKKVEPINIDSSTSQLKKALIDTLSNTNDLYVYEDEPYIETDDMGDEVNITISTSPIDIEDVIDNEFMHRLVIQLEQITRENKDGK